MTETLALTDIRNPNPDELHQAFGLRRDILDNPLGATIDYPRPKDLDRDTIHMAAFINLAMVSTVRLRPVTPFEYLVERMATDERFRGLGISAKVLETAELSAIERGADSFRLLARVGTESFYGKAGYSLTGEPARETDEVTLIPMSKLII